MPKFPKKSLILCVHAHQPVGNFDWVILEAYEKSYLPFFRTLEKHPSIALSCHFSGSLMDWIEKNKPEFIELLRSLLGRGQIEILGGAYYEPIYGAVPPRDLTGQIGMMRAKIRSIFGTDPEGGWLTERVWDSNLVKPIRQSGLRYTVLDDSHFELAGLSSPVTGFYHATTGLKTLDLFASMKQLRYLIPFRKPEEALDFIRRTEAGSGDALVFADDCEKFGFWPGTYSWVYGQDAWLEKFFKLLEENNKEIRTYTFSQVRRKFKSKGKVRIPHASYSEMMEWSGGCFYDFFEKYPESRYLKERMWGLSDRVHRACPPKRQWRVSARNGHDPKITQAVQALYKAQCNCAYWHGVFGGLYLHHLRSAIFENLIKADTLLTEYALKGKKNKGSQIYRERMDSGDRWVIRQKEILLFFNPRYGGALEEIDFIPKSVNLTCNLKRHKEPYHQTVLHAAPSPNAADKPLSIHQILGAKESNLEQHLFYDTFQRLSFMDHVFNKEITSNEFSESSYTEAGDFIASPFRARVGSQWGAKTLTFHRKGSALLSGKKRSFGLTKTVIPGEGGAFAVGYRLSNESVSHAELTVGVEFNFSIGDSYAAKGLSEKEVRDWVFKDQWRGIQIRIRLDEPWSLLTAPVETVSESESGLEKTYQELGVLFQKTFFLESGETREYRVEVECS